MDALTNSSNNGSQNSNLDESFRPKKILVVDDEALIVEILMAALQDQGYIVEGANSGEEAIRMFKESPADIVISDITMSRVSGIELLFTFKKINEHVEVILITGFASVETAQAAIEGKAYRYLKKPFKDIQEILDIVAEACGQQKRKVDEVAQFQEVIQQRNHFQQRLKQLETMYLIGHAVGFPENLSKMLVDVAKLLYRTIPISLMAGWFQEKEHISIFILPIHPWKESELQNFQNYIQQECAKNIFFKVSLEPTIYPKLECIQKIGKLIDIPFPLWEGGMKGSLWLNFSESYHLQHDEEELLEVTAAQIAGAIRKLQEFQQKERERMHLVIEGMLDGVILLSEGELNIELANTAAHQLLRAKNLTELTEEIQKAEIWPMILEFKKKQCMTAKEIKLKDGRIFSMALWPLPHTWELNYAIILHDLTHQYQLQKELERSHRLSMVGELVSGVTHEIATPLSLILGYSQIMRSQKLPYDVHSTLGLICDEVGRCQKLIQSLLGFTRSLERIPIDIVEIIEKALELKKFDLRKHNITIIRNYKEKALVQVDPNQIQQVLLNLINNAQDAMELQKEKFLEIEVSCKDGFAVIIVSDTGTGISPENLEKMFDPFFTTKPPGKGNGLGLSVSYKIIQEHKGQIFVENNSKHSGAVFTISLPIYTNQSL